MASECCQVEVLWKCPLCTEGRPFLPAQSSSKWRKSSCSLLFAIMFVQPGVARQQGGEAVVLLWSEGTDWGLPSAWKGPQKMAASSGGSCGCLYFTQHPAVLRECFLYFSFPPPFFLQVIYKQQGSPCFWFQLWQQQVLQPSTAAVPCPALSPSLGLCETYSLGILCQCLPLHAGCQVGVKLGCFPGADLFLHLSAAKSLYSDQSDPRLEKERFGLLDMDKTCWSVLYSYCSALQWIGSFLAAITGKPCTQILLPLKDGVLISYFQSCGNLPK